MSGRKCENLRPAGTGRPACTSVATLAADAKKLLSPPQERLERVPQSLNGGRNSETAIWRLQPTRASGISAAWSCGRVAEGGGLLNRYRVVKPYRGFESLRLRQNVVSDSIPLYQYPQ